MPIYDFGDMVLDPQKYPWGYGVYVLAITIDSTKIDSDLTHFPLPIPLGASVGINNFDTQRVFDALGTDYQKLRVTDSNGNDLYVEVEQWDATNKKGLLWVSRDTWTIAAANDLKIYLHFDPEAADNTSYVGTPGNRTEVWHSGLKGFWSLSQDPGGGAGSLIDSTSNGNHGDPGGGLSSADLVDGFPAGKSLDFEEGEYVELPDIDWQISEAFTLKATVKNTGGLAQIIADDNGIDNRTYQFRVNADGTLQLTRFHVGGTYAGATSTLVVNDGDVYRVVGKFSNIVGSKLFIGGVEEALNPDTTNNNSAIGHNPCIATRRSSSDTEPYTGIIDNPSIANTYESDAWTKADAYAHADNLLTFGV